MCMGHNRPARVIPAHDEYSPTLKLDAFKQVVTVANQTRNVNLIDGLIDLVIADINADNNAGRVSNQHIRNYYRNYYDILNASPLANSAHLSMLLAIV